MLLQQGKLVTQGTLQDVIAAASPGGLTIEVAPEELEAARRDRRPRSSVGETRVEQASIVTTVTPEDPALVTHRLADAGIYLRGLSVRRATLEDAFLALTHKEEQS